MAWVARSSFPIAPAPLPARCVVARARGGRSAGLAASAAGVRGGLPWGGLLLWVSVFGSWGCAVASVVFASSSPLPVAVVGSRSLPPCGPALVARVVRALARAGRPLCVGCAVGADSAALSAAVAAGCAPSVSVFAVGGSSGSGFCSLSALPGVRAAAAAGASVSWWSGGPASVPLAARLACRSRACVAAAPGGLVALLSSPSSAGSLAAVSLAAASGLPAFVFCLGFSPSLLPSLGGSWVPAAAAGLWSAAVRFVPPPSLF